MSFSSVNGVNWSAYVRILSIIRRPEVVPVNGIFFTTLRVVELRKESVSFHKTAVSSVFWINEFSY